MYKRHEALAHLSFSEFRSTADISAAFGLSTEATRLRLNLLLKEGAVVGRTLYRPKRREWKKVEGFEPPALPNYAKPHGRTISLVNEHMSGLQYQSARELAPLFGCTPEAMAQKLLRLYDNRVVERALDTTLERGGNRYLWRKVPEGFIAPIYDAQPGVCGRALDEALGGFTYLKANSTVEHQCSTKQQ